MTDAGTIEVHRRLLAPIGEVFRWWTEPDLLREWMTPRGAVEADVDLRIGGALRVVMKGDGRVIEHTGTYLEIDPPRRLVFTWLSPYTGSAPSLVTIDLHSSGDDVTDLHLVHSRLPDEAARSHGQGWGAMLDRLGGRLAPMHGVSHVG